MQACGRGKGAQRVRTLAELTKACGSEAGGSGPAQAACVHGAAENNCCCCCCCPLARLGVLSAPRSYTYALASCCLPHTLLTSRSSLSLCTCTAQTTQHRQQQRGLVRRPPATQHAPGMYGLLMLLPAFRLRSGLLACVYNAARTAAQVSLSPGPARGSRGAPLPCCAVC